MKRVAWTRQELVALLVGPLERVAGALVRDVASTIRPGVAGARARGASAGAVAESVARVSFASARIDPRHAHDARPSETASTAMYDGPRERVLAPRGELTGVSGAPGGARAVAMSASSATGSASAAGPGATGPSAGAPGMASPVRSEASSSVASVQAATMGVESSARRQRPLLRVRPRAQDLGAQASATRSGGSTARARSSTPSAVPVAMVQGSSATEVAARHAGGGRSGAEARPRSTGATARLSSRSSRAAEPAPASMGSQRERARPNAVRSAQRPLGALLDRGGERGESVTFDGSGDPQRVFSEVHPAPPGIRSRGAIHGAGPRECVDEAPVERDPDVIERELAAALRACARRHGLEV